MAAVWTDWRVWTPLLTGFALSVACPVTGGQRLPQTPPESVFPIVWTILYVCVGVSWKRARDLAPDDAAAEVAHRALVGLLCLWIIVYSCRNDKVAGFYVLATIVATCVACMTLHGDRTSKLLLTPLLAWTLIAMQINFRLADGRA